MTFGAKKIFDSRTKGEIDDGKTKLSSSALFVNHGISNEWVGYTISLGDSESPAADPSGADLGERRTLPRLPTCS